MTSAYLDLARRCEELEPDWGEIVRLNEDIHAITSDPKTVVPPDYCRSLDAAMSLVPEGASYDLRTSQTSSGALAMIHPARMRPTVTVRAATPALAFCAAALRAQAEAEQ